jgi:hypothetical protein
MFFALTVGAPKPPAPLLRGPIVNIFALMLGALGPPALPPRGPTIDVFSIDGGLSRTSGAASQGAHHQHFLY